MKALGVITIHATYSESSYFSLLNDVSLITVNHKLWKVLICYRFYHFYIKKEAEHITYSFDYANLLF